ncbi:PLP-dependent aminotransferase family protein [bacterium]|nr:PLP-dependent aminotransferase family protein [bacterium]
MIRLSKSALHMRSSEIRDLMSVAVDPDIISFAGGMPNNDLFPIAEVDEIYQRLPLRVKQEGFQYGPTGGYPPLLESLSRFLESKGLPVKSNQLMITSGSLQAINLIGKIMLDPGDVAITETPCFIGAISAFKSYQAELAGVPMDADGIIAGKLRQALDAYHERCKLVYLTPNFHNPAGTIYSRERRQEVLTLLQNRNVILVEDDAYSDLYFDESDRDLTRSLKAMGPEPVPICYCGSFSKIFGPGMRLGWLLASKEIVRQCEIAKQSIDACSSTFTQVLANEFLVQNKLPGYLQRIRPIYRRRCERLLESLQKYMPAEVAWNHPKGGFYIWVKLPEDMDATEVLKKAIPLGAVFVVGKTFDPNGTANEHLRLSFCHMPEDKMEKGVQIIAAAIQAVQAGR